VARRSLPIYVLAIEEGGTGGGGSANSNDSKKVWPSLFLLLPLLLNAPLTGIGQT
jgi:hypothetical protein